MGRIMAAFAGDLVSDVEASKGTRVAMRAGLAVTAIFSLSGAAIGLGGPKVATGKGPLLPLSLEQIRSAKAGGTGCSWSMGKGGLVRFAAADDHAVIRLSSGVRQLRPAADARDLFPFTFDGWTGDGVTVKVISAGSATRFGTEALRKPANLVIAEGGRRTGLRGRLTCGS